MRWWSRATRRAPSASSPSWCCRHQRDHRQPHQRVVAGRHRAGLVAVVLGRAAHRLGRRRRTRRRLPHGSHRRASLLVWPGFTLRCGAPARHTTCADGHGLSHRGDPVRGADGQPPQGFGPRARARTIVRATILASGHVVGGRAVVVARLSHPAAAWLAGVVRVGSPSPPGAGTVPWMCASLAANHGAVDRRHLVAYNGDLHEMSEAINGGRYFVIPMVLVCSWSERASSGSGSCRCAPRSWFRSARCSCSPPPSTSTCRPPAPTHWTRRRLHPRPGGVPRDGQPRQLLLRPPTAARCPSLTSSSSPTRGGHLADCVAALRRQGPAVGRSS